MVPVTTQEDSGALAAYLPRAPSTREPGARGWRRPWGSHLGAPEWGWRGRSRLHPFPDPEGCDRVVFTYCQAEYTGPPIR